MNQQKTVKGYKVFRPDWTCRGFQYQVGKSYEMDEEPIICKRGYHFCTKLIDCYVYYSFDENNKVAEITAYGKISIDENGQKSCTNKIKIERKLEWQEVLNMVNIGHHNSGHHNSGNYNSGNYNSGDCNSGNYNSGNSNNGYYNSGNYNSGDYNSGDCNNGYYNNGYHNSGDYNVTNYSSGCFNTEATKIFIFNKLSDWTLNDWKNSTAKFILDNTLVSPVDPIMETAMTEKEKEEHPEYKTLGFYLKRLSREEIANRNQKKWDELDKTSKEVVMSIPNFDKKIFKQITGIDVDRSASEIISIGR